jgi:hypothetical protein
MMKFFRKYNKVLLAVFMTLLMIVFVAAQAFESFLAPNPGAITAWSSSLGPITHGEMQDYAARLNVASRLNIDRMGNPFPWQFRLIGPQEAQAAGFTPTDISPMDMILLNREAQKLGFVPNAGPIRDAWTASSETKRVIDQLAFDARMNPDVVYQTTAEINNVAAVARAMAAAARPSEAEIRAAAREALDKIKVQAVVLNAKAFEDMSYEPTEEEMQAHFKQYQSKERGFGMDFGYVVPSTVKLQYLAIDANVIAEQLKAAVEMDDLAASDPNMKGNALGHDIVRAARRYYTDNRTKDSTFQRMIPSATIEPVSSDAGAADAADGTNAATDEPAVDPGKSGAQAEDAPASPPAGEGTADGANAGAVDNSLYMTWEEARPLAIEIECRRRAQEIANAMATWIIQQSTEAWRDAERGEDRYRKLPAGVNNADYYMQLLKSAPRQLSYPQAVSLHETEFFAAADAAQVPVLGRTISGSAGFSRLPFNYQGITEIAEQSASADHLAMFETSRASLSDPFTNQTFVFRPIASRKPHPADTLDEVRSKVIKDMRLQRAFEQAKQHAENIASAARQADQTLQAAYEADPELAKIRLDLVKANEMKYIEPAPFAMVIEDWAGLPPGPRPRPSFVPGLGIVSRPAVEKMFAIARENGLAVIEEPEGPKVYVIRALEFIPGREDEYEQLRESLIARMTNGRAGTVLASWFAPEQIKARLGAKPVTN